MNNMKTNNIKPLSVFVAIDWVLLLIFYSDQELIQIPTVTEYFRSSLLVYFSVYRRPHVLMKFPRHLNHYWRLNALKIIESV